jgi:hypothetical protein
VGVFKLELLDTLGNSVKAESSFVDFISRSEEGNMSIFRNLVAFPEIVPNSVN